MESVDGTKVYTTCEHHKVNVGTEQTVAWMEKMRKKKEREEGRGVDVVETDVKGVSEGV